MSETKFLGFIITKEGLKADPEKVEAVKNYPRPSNTKGVRQFLGLVSFYRRFIPGFADIAEPLNLLTRKNAKFKWSDEAEFAFKSFGEKLTSPPILVYPDFKKPFRVVTDASNVGLGAILCQADAEGNEWPISYASRALNTTERSYSTIEKETLALLFALKQFRPYLHGVTFEHYTDHQPLTYNKRLNSD